MNLATPYSKRTAKGTDLNKR